ARVEEAGRVRREFADHGVAAVVVVVVVVAVVPEHPVPILDPGVVGPREVDALIVDRRGAEVGRPDRRRCAGGYRKARFTQTVGGVRAVTHRLLGRASVIVERGLSGDERPEGRPARPAVKRALDAVRVGDPGGVVPVRRDDAARGRIGPGYGRARWPGGGDRA